MVRRNPKTGKFIRKDDFTRKELLKQIHECHRRYGKVTRSLVIKDEEFANRSSFDREFGSFGNAVIEAGLSDVGRVRLTDSELIELDKKVRENERWNKIFEGLVLGDGYISQTENSESLLGVSMMNRQFLDWLDSELSNLSTGVQLDKTSGVSAENARKSGFRPNAKDENYHDIFRVRTRRLPFFTEQKRRWYKNGSKRYPTDLTLTPLSAKIWYCGDGGVNITNNTSEIRCRNEQDRGEYIESLFDATPVSPQYKDERIHFRKESSRFLEWIGKPLPGFKYKWMIDDKEKYHTNKNNQR